jgi:tRNA (cmo5U34)-methyltransferase
MVSKPHPGEDRDQGYAAEAWAFDEEVTRVFDDMLTRSIPQYDVMRAACVELACRYRRPNTDIADLGCSRGGAIADLVNRFGAENHFVGVEVSQPMLKACRQRFQPLINQGVVDILDMDLREDYPDVQASVTMAVLCIQFTPIEYRQRIVRNIFDHTLPGGVAIVVEKLIGETSESDQVFVDLYYQMKRQMGYTQEEIDRKRLSLEGKLVPVTARWNEELLEKAGFAHVECFWRWMNFAGWIAVRGD